MDVSEKKSSEEKTTESALWWQVLKSQGTTHLGTFVDLATPRISELLAKRDISFALAWFPVFGAAQRLIRTLISIAYEVQHAVRHEKFNLQELNVPSRVLEEYQALIASVPEHVSWLSTIERLDELYMSWLKEPDTRAALMAIVKSAEGQLDAFLANFLDLILSPQTPAELGAMSKFLDRTQIFLERLLEDIIMPNVVGLTPSKASTTQEEE